MCLHCSPASEHRTKHFALSGHAAQMHTDWNSCVRHECCHMCCSVSAVHTRLPAWQTHHHLVTENSAENKDAQSTPPVTSQNVVANSCIFGLYCIRMFGFLIFMYLLLCIWVRRESDPFTGGCEPLWGCWDFSSGHLEEQPTAKPPSQP